MVQVILTSFLTSPKMDRNPEINYIYFRTNAD